MQIKIIGSDWAFDGLNTSLFFRDDAGRGILVDCGFSVFPELTRLKLRGEVDVVLISHLHSDHTGSLCTLAVWARMFNKKAVKIWGEGVGELFDVQGIFPEDFIPLPPDDPLVPEFIKTGHIPTKGHNNALFIAGKILYSGDTNESLLDTDYARRAKIIFHEVVLRESASHVHFETLVAVPPEIKAKTWLIHISPHERAEITRLAAEMGFAGVCTNGQEIEC
ncbi:MAG: MBL fold metallo-hydrolase [Alphaproteobacteria bacterium]|nr:MBL fold metallo-hydrolase [Alphaproteobacteria bacterium]